MRRVRFRGSLLFAAIAVAASTTALFACFGSDPIVTKAEDAATDGSTGSSDADVPTDGGPPDEGETGPPPKCPADRLIDDFEGRTDVLGCWTTLTNGFDASVQIAPGHGEDGGNALRIQVSGPGGEQLIRSTHLVRTLSVKTPAVVRWRFLISLPNFNDARSGFYPLTLRYSDTSSQAASDRMLIGSPGVDLLSAFIDGEEPNDTKFDSSKWHQAELQIGTSLVLRIDGQIFSEHTLPSPAKDLIAVELGITAGTIDGTYQIAYDDVSVGPIF